MNWVQFCVETAATVIEAWIILSTVVGIVGCRYAGRDKHFRIILLTLIFTIVVTVLNSFQLFSFVTIVLSVLMTLIVSGFIANHSVLLRFFASVLTFLGIHAVDYMVLFTMGILMEKPITNAYTFSALFIFGPQRCLYLLIVKIIHISLYAAVNKHLSKLRLIPKRHLSTLSIITLAAYIAMSVLLSLILSESIVGMQLAVICLWLFILLCVCITLCLTFFTSKYQNEKATNKLLKVCNSIMEENYQRLHNNQQAKAKLIHDYNHHLLVLRGLLEQHKYDDIEHYLDSMMDTCCKEEPMCKSGNDVINAIINCKSSEAREYNIEFKYNISTDVPSSLLSIDLCAILANQIDNAFDACKRIETYAQRTIDVHIWQNSDNIFLFQVSNSVVKNPFIENPELNSTKADGIFPHGIGLKSIKDTAEKYGGMLENSYHDGRFYSTVFIDLSA